MQRIKLAFFILLAIFLATNVASQSSELSGDYLYIDMNVVDSGGRVLYPDSNDRTIRELAVVDTLGDLPNTDSWEDAGGTGDVLVQESDPKKIPSTVQRYRWTADSTEDPRVISGLSDLTGQLDDNYDLGECDEFSGNKRQTCRVLNTEWRGAGHNYGEGDVASATDIHEQDAFAPLGQIIMGFEAGNQNNLKFFVCNDGMDGFAVNKLPASSGYDGYRCDAEGNSEGWRDNNENDWEQVSSCNDGVDNDGDGAIDYQNNIEGTPSDPNCDSIQDTEFSTGCVPRIAEEGIKNTRNSENVQINQKAVYYDSTSTDLAGGVKYSPSDSECIYNELDTDVNVDTSQSPREFECMIDSSGDGVAQGYDGNAAADTFCQNRLNSLGYNSDGEDGNDKYASNRESIDAVQYYVPKDVIPVGANDYATPNGFRAYGFQTIHQAESKYANNNLHAESTWTGKSMTSTDGYGDGDGDTSDHRNAWKVANAGNQSSAVWSARGGQQLNLESEGGFEGGFAGNCPEGLYWVNNGEGWSCSIPGSGGIMTVNPYVSVEYESGDEVYAGFQINESQLNVWEEYYPFSDVGGNSNTGALYVASQCWVGGQDARPGDLSKVENVSYNADSDTDLSVLASPPMRSSVDSDLWTCIFGLHQEANLNNFELGSSRFAFDEDGELAPSGDPEAWLVQGSNTQGNLRVMTGNSLNPAGNADPDKTEMRDWYSNNYDQTHTISDDIWPMYPKEGQIPAAEGDLNPRHPGEFHERGGDTVDIQAPPNNENDDSSGDQSNVNNLDSSSANPSEDINEASWALW